MAEERRSGSRLIAMLVLVQIVVHIAFAAVPPPRQLGVLGVVVEATFLLGGSQATLVAVWVAFGGGRLPGRVLATVVGLAVYVHFFYFHVVGNDRLIFAVGHLALMSACLLIARAEGVELRRCDDASIASRPPRFTIRDMLLWMTSLAVGFGSLRHSLGWAFPDLSRQTITGYGSLLLVAGVSIASVLSNGRLLVRLLPVPPIIGLAAAVLLWNQQSNSSYYRISFCSIGLAVTVMCAWIAGSLLVVRFAGYRLMWRGKRR